MDGTEIRCLDHGFVRLDGSMADDWSVVNAARVSFNRQEDRPVADGPLDQEGYIEAAKVAEKNAGLINFLMKNRHGTPFEHNAFRFHIKCPIFVAREWMRHRIGSFNEWSGRYSKLEAEFYVPSYVRRQTGKPGAYTFEEVDPGDTKGIQKIIERSSKESFYNYEWMMDQEGIAKEVARMVLPVNIYTQFYWTINARSLMNFISLRSDEQAMFEIRQYSQALEKLFEEKMPVTYKFFVEGGRVAP